MNTTQQNVAHSSDGTTTCHTPIIPTHDDVTGYDRIQKQDEPPKHQVHRSRAIVMAILVPIAYFAGGIPADVMAPQYFVHRLAEDRGQNVTTPRVSLCGNLSDPTVKLAKELEAEASNLVINYTYAMNGPGMLYAIFVAGFSDMYGRRPFIILAAFGGTARLTITWIMTAYNLPLWLNYISCSIDGATGGFYALLLGCYATMADVNPGKQQRILCISVLMSSFAVASAFFLVVSGSMIDSSGFPMTSLVVALCTGSSFLLSLFFYPETCPMLVKREYHPLTNFRRISAFFVSKGTTRKRVMIALCLFMFFLNNMNTIGVYKVDALYQLKQPFCWSSLYIGLYYGSRLAGGMLLSVLLLKLLQRFIADEWICFLGALTTAASYVTESFITEGWQFIIVPIIGILGGASIPIVRGMVSVLAGPNDQAAIFACVAVIEVACSAVSAALFLKVYSATVSVMPGAVYLVIASCSVLSAFIIIVYQCIKEKAPSEKGYEHIGENVPQEHTQTREQTVQTS